MVKLLTPRIIQFLRGKFERNQGYDATVEYRLACSGVLHNGDLITSDWTKSTASRVVSPKVFTLLVASSRIDDYPQELALRFKCPMVSEAQENWRFDFRPDDEIAADIAALLTLYVRRLVKVYCKVREVSESPPSPDFLESLRDFPSPTMGGNLTYWPPRPSTILTMPKHDQTGWHPKQEIRSHMPRPVPISPKKLGEFLTKMAKQEDELGSRLIASARLYQKGLALLYENYDIAYQLLVSAVETISNFSILGYPPPVKKIMEKKQDLVKLLEKYIDHPQHVRRIMEFIGKQIPWSQDRFLEFIEKHLPNDALSQSDPLYPELSIKELIPKPQNIARSLKEIYRQRSASSHEGRPYPAHVSVGMSPMISWDATRALYSAMGSDKSVPPISWFERVVQATIVNFVESSV